MKIIKSDFTQGIVWNYISVFFLAVGGLTFSFLIGLYYDAETLGNFNLIFTYYSIFSQFGVWGCHMAVTKYVSEYAHEILVVNKILSSAIVSVAVFSGVFDGIVLLICNCVMEELLPVALLRSISSIMIAIFFFSINKVILGYLNGLSRMKEYAIFQSLRNILIALWIIIFVICEVPGVKLTYCFEYTEIMLFFLLVLLIVKREKFKLCVSMQWIKKIFAFGTHIMPANIVLELSTKVDVLCLFWILKNEEIVGIYSFAALFGEGFYQLFVVLRRSINPHITQRYLKKELGGYYVLIEKMIRKFGYLSGTVCLLVIVLGFRFLCFLTNDTGYYAGTLPLLIITIAIVCNMKSIIFGNMLSQTGYPVAESINNIITVISNFILNILFIHQWGMVGAAMATGASYFIFSINQKRMLKKRIQLY